MTHHPSLTTHHLTHKYADGRVALDDVSFAVEAGECVAIVGPNRPRLYWTFAAAQALGAIPVPVYADAVAEEMAYVLDHAGVRFAMVSDQEQVDKIRSFAERIPSLGDIIYDEPRGLTDYDPRRLHSFEKVQERGRELLAADPSAASRWVR